MVFVNSDGYLEKKSHGNKTCWLLKCCGRKGKRVEICNSTFKVSFPPEYFGKRIRFKIEIDEKRSLKKFLEKGI